VPRDQAAHCQEAKRNEFSHSKLDVDSDRLHAPTALPPTYIRYETGRVKDRSL